MDALSLRKYNPDGESVQILGIFSAPYLAKQSAGQLSSPAEVSLRGILNDDIYYIVKIVYPSSSDMCGNSRALEPLAWELKGYDEAVGLYNELYHLNTALSAEWQTPAHTDPENEEFEDPDHIPSFELDTNRPANLLPFDIWRQQFEETSKAASSKKPAPVKTDPSPPAARERIADGVVGKSERKAGAIRSANFSPGKSFFSYGN